MYLHMDLREGPKGTGPGAHLSLASPLTVNVAVWKEGEPMHRGTLKNPQGEPMLPVAPPGANTLSLRIFGF